MSFGADTDIWGFADTNIHLVSVTPSDPSNTEATVADSYGDIAASTFHDTVTNYSATYRACSTSALVFYDTLTAVDFRLGKVISSKVITSVQVTTSNTERAEIVIAGRSTSTADTDMGKFKYDDLEIATPRKAVGIGVTEDTVTNVVGSSATASVNVAVQLDSDGDLACMDVYGATLEASNDLVGVTGDPGAAVDSGWTITSGPSINQENTGYATGSVTVKKNLTRDT